MHTRWFGVCVLERFKGTIGDYPRLNHNCTAHHPGSGELGAFLPRSARLDWPPLCLGWVARLEGQSSVIVCCQDPHHNSGDDWSGASEGLLWLMRSLVILEVLPSSVGWRSVAFASLTTRCRFLSNFDLHRQRVNRCGSRLLGKNQWQPKWWKYAPAMLPQETPLSTLKPGRIKHYASLPQVLCRKSRGL
jgi:hypothetical protein